MLLPLLPCRVLFKLFEIESRLSNPTCLRCPQCLLFLLSDCHPCQHCLKSLSESRFPFEYRLRLNQWHSHLQDLFQLYLHSLNFRPSRFPTKSSLDKWKWSDHLCPQCLLSQRWDRSRSSTKTSRLLKDHSSSLAVSCLHCQRCLQASSLPLKSSES